MQEDMFYRFGKFIYKLRWPIIVLWLIAVISCIPVLPKITTAFKDTGFVDKNSPSAKADQYLSHKLGYNNNRIIIIYHSKKLANTDPLYRDQIKKSLSELKHFPIKHEIIYPDSNKKQQLSKDKHTAYVVILFKGNESISHALLSQFESSIKKQPHMTMKLGGEPVFVESVNKQTQVDLYKADFIAAPVSIITLLFVFGTLVAAILPMILGGACAIVILASLYALAHIFSLSVFTLNIALLLGLCLSLDYSLFFIYRFRTELRNGSDITEAIAITQATAGKAIFFSGLAVFASLSALLLFPINILFSVGIGGLSAVLFAVLIAIILLPAVLSVINKQINLFPVRIINNNGQGFQFWEWLATKVIHYPKTFFITIIMVLLLLGYPFLNSKFGISDFRILPKQSDSRQFFDIYKEKFNENELTPIFILVEAHNGSILSKKNISKLYDYSLKLKDNPLVYRINSIVNTDPVLTKLQYQELYNKVGNLHNDNIKKLLTTTTLKHMTVMTVTSKYKGDSPETKKLVAQLHHINPGKGMSVKLTGTPVINIEVLNSISTIFPYAILWIVIFTYIILLILLRSLFLPLKAILMNIFSLCASYGVLVFIIQEGHLSQFLNFEPQGMLDVSLLVIIFCALFGFSMDYEVFLLTRIKEFYDKTGDNDKSIVFGIVQSSRIITSAAIIVILICCSFMVADVIMVKAFGLGIAVAIFVDAFLIRTFLVPATMTLVKQLNWYLPKWLNKILPKC